MASRLDIDEYKPKWESMTEGQQIRVDHENCPAGVDKRQRLYLKKIDGKILGYCHHCSSSAVVSLKGKSSYKSVAALLEMEKPIPGGKLELPLDARLVFTPECTRRDPAVPVTNSWFNPLEMKGRGGLSQAEAESCIKVYLHRCGMLLPGILTLRPITQSLLRSVPSEYCSLDMEVRHGLNENSVSTTFQAESLLMARFWQNMRFSPSQCRLFIPYWNSTNLYHPMLAGNCNVPPSGYLGRCIIPEDKWAPGKSPAKWLKYPGEHGKGANVYTWNHHRTTPNPARYLQVYVEDLMSQMRIVQALYRSFLNHNLSHIQAGDSVNSTVHTTTQIHQRNILHGVDGIRIICLQGTSMQKDLLDIVINTKDYMMDAGTRWCAAAWTDLDVAGRKAALSLVTQPLSGAENVAFTVVADEPKNMSDAGIIRELAMLTPNWKGWS